MGGHTWFSSNINYWSLLFAWRVSHSLITEIVIAGIVVGTRYVVMKKILLVWSCLHGTSSLLAEESLSRKSVGRWTCYSLRTLDIKQSLPASFSAVCTLRPSRGALCDQESWSSEMRPGLCSWLGQLLICKWECGFITITQRDVVHSTSGP